VEEGFQEQSEATGLLPSQEDVCMHLTNYAINKHNENFVRDDAVGSKRYSLLCFPLFPLPLSPTASGSHMTQMALGRLIS
jgi:hypothetical protein